MPEALAEIMRALRFAVVGLAATLVHLVIAQAALVSGAFTQVPANTLGFAVAFAAGLVGHHHFTFGRSAPFWRAFRRYGVIALAGFLFNNVMLVTLDSTGVVGESTALTIAILIVPVGTFIASRFWGFVAADTR